MKRRSPIADALLVLTVGLTASCGSGGGVHVTGQAGASGGAGQAAGGTSGSGGLPAMGGAAGAGAGGASGGKPSGQSAGCGKPVNETAGQWTTHDTMVTVDAKFAAQT